MTNIYLEYLHVSFMRGIAQPQQLPITQPAMRRFRIQLLTLHQRHDPYRIRPPALPLPVVPPHEVLQIRLALVLHLLVLHWNIILDHARYHVVQRVQLGRRLLRLGRVCDGRVVSLVAVLFLHQQVAEGGVFLFAARVAAAVVFVLVAKSDVRQPAQRRLLVCNNTRLMNLILGNFVSRSTFDG